MADRSKYQRAVQGDIAYNMMRMWQGAVGVVPTDGLVSPAYVVARPYPEVDAGYFAYLFRTADYMRQVEIYSRGIVPDRNRLYWDSFKRISSPVPAVDEQRQIVRFLDNHGALTARLIRAKQRIVKLLEEQKQAIIHRALTRGLDPNVRLKPSGIPWLGNVPEHWETVSLGAAATSIQTGPFGSQLPATSYVTGGIPVINPSHISRGEIRSDPRVSITPSMARFLGRHQIKPLDIIMARRGELGRSAVVSDRESGWICGTGSVRVRPIQEILSSYFVATLFGIQGVRDVLKASSIGATMDNLNEGMVARVKLPRPPVHEQNKILKFIESEFGTVELTIERINKEIALVREFRARLIADVVTGKLDVRAAAAALPEITETEFIEEPAEGEDFEEALDNIENKEVAA
jgi:type I restriction enzyme, S subunit